MSAEPAKLPVAIASVSAASAAPAAASPAPTSAASTVTSPATAASAAPFALRARFIDHQRAAQKVPAVQRRDCLFGFRIVADFGESEAARLTRETVAEQRK
jgi:hypothetical protein